MLLFPNGPVRAIDAMKTGAHEFDTSVLVAENLIRPGARIKVHLLVMGRHRSYPSLPGF